MYTAIYNGNSLKLFKSFARPLYFDKKFLALSSNTFSGSYL